MANLELTLRDIVHVAANAAALSGASLLAIALCAELVRRRHSGSALVRVADRVMPATAHRVAAGILTLLATVASVATPSVASADTSLRGWLESPSVPTTVVTLATDSASARPPAHNAAGPANHAGRVPSPRAVPQPQSGPSASTSSEPVPAPAPNPASPPPVPIAPPSPSAATVLHPHTPASPPPSSPGPTRSPSTRALTPVAPANPTPTAPAPADPPRAVESSVRYEVVAGDCLWDIAARLIGPRPPNAAIDRAWRAIYAANRAVIGDDPGLIRPGLVLTIPAIDPTS